MQEKEAKISDKKRKNILNSLDRRTANFLAKNVLPTKEEEMPCETVRGVEKKRSAIKYSVELIVCSDGLKQWTAYLLDE